MFSLCFTLFLLLCCCVCVGAQCLALLGTGTEDNFGSPDVFHPLSSSPWPEETTWYKKCPDGETASPPFSCQNASWAPPPGWDPTRFGDSTYGPKCICETPVVDLSVVSGSSPGSPKLQWVVQCHRAGRLHIFRQLPTAAVVDIDSVPSTTTAYQDGSLSNRGMNPDFGAGQSVDYWLSFYGANAPTTPSFLTDTVTFTVPFFGSIQGKFQTGGAHSVPVGNAKIVIGLQRSVTRDELVVYQARLQYEWLFAVYMGASPLSTGSGNFEWDIVVPLPNPFFGTGLDTPANKLVQISVFPIGEVSNLPPSTAAIGPGLCGDASAYSFVPTARIPPLADGSLTPVAFSPSSNQHLVAGGSVFVTSPGASYICVSTDSAVACGPPCSPPDRTVAIAGSSGTYVVPKPAGALHLYAIACYPPTASETAAASYNVSVDPLVPTISGLGLPLIVGVAEVTVSSPGAAYLCAMSLFEHLETQQALACGVPCPVGTSIAGSSGTFKVGAGGFVGLAAIACKVDENTQSASQNRTVFFLVAPPTPELSPNLAAAIALSSTVEVISPGAGYICTALGEFANCSTNSSNQCSVGSTISGPSGEFVAPKDPGLYALTVVSCGVSGASPTLLALFEVGIPPAFTLVPSSSSSGTLAGFPALSPPLTTAVVPSTLVTVASTVPASYICAAVGEFVTCGNCPAPSIIAGSTTAVPSLLSGQFAVPQLVGRCVLTAVSCIASDVGGLVLFVEFEVGNYLLSNGITVLPGSLVGLSGPNASFMCLSMDSATQAKCGATKCLGGNSVFIPGSVGISTAPTDLGVHSATLTSCPLGLSSVLEFNVAKVVPPSFSPPTEFVLAAAPATVVSVSASFAASLCYRVDGDAALLGCDCDVVGSTHVLGLAAIISFDVQVAPPGSQIFLVAIACSANQQASSISSATYWVAPEPEFSLATGAITLPLSSVSVSAGRASFICAASDSAPPSCSSCPIRIQGSTGTLPTSANAAGQHNMTAVTCNKNSDGSLVSSAPATLLYQSVAAFAPLFSPTGNIFSATLVSVSSTNASLICVSDIGTQRGALTLSCTFPGGCSVGATEILGSFGTITVAASQALAAVACTSYGPSSVSIAVFALVAPPIFSPPNGSLPPSATVALSAPNARYLCYSAVGNTTLGCSAREVCPFGDYASGSAAIIALGTSLGTQTLSSVACYADDVASVVSVAVYNVTLVLPPTFSIAGGAVVLPSTLVTVLSEGADYICLTAESAQLDCNPTCQQQAAGPATFPAPPTAIFVPGSSGSFLALADPGFQTWTALACSNARGASAFSSAAYTVLSRPLLSAPSSVVRPSTTVTVSSINATYLCSTLDGSTPSCAGGGSQPACSTGSLLLGSVGSVTIGVLPQNIILSALGCGANHAAGPVVTATYTVLAPPFFNPPNGLILPNTDVTLTSLMASFLCYRIDGNATLGCSLVDGSCVDATTICGSSGTFPVSTTRTIVAIACSDTFVASPIASSAYTVVPAYDPVFSPFNASVVLPGSTISISSPNAAYLCFRPDGKGGLLGCTSSGACLGGVRIGGSSGTTSIRSSLGGQTFTALACSLDNKASASTSSVYTVVAALPPVSDPPSESVLLPSALVTVSSSGAAFLCFGDRRSSVPPCPVPTASTSAAPTTATLSITTTTTTSPTMTSPPPILSLPSCLPGPSTTFGVPDQRVAAVACSATGRASTASVLSYKLLAAPTFVAQSLDTPNATTVLRSTRLLVTSSNALYLCLDGSGAATTPVCSADGGASCAAGTLTLGPTASLATSSQPAVQDFTAVACGPNALSSAVSRRTYVTVAALAPIFSLEPGAVVLQNTNMTLSSPSAAYMCYRSVADGGDARIACSPDGTCPYGSFLGGSSGNITLSLVGPQTMTAVACSADELLSEKSELRLTVLRPIGAPVFEPPNGTSLSDTMPDVAMAAANSAYLCVTLDGSVPKCSAPTGCENSVQSSGWKLGLGTQRVAAVGCNQGLSGPLGLANYTVYGPGTCFVTPDILSSSASSTVLRNTTLDMNGIGGGQRTDWFDYSLVQIRGSVRFPWLLNNLTSCGLPNVGVFTNGKFSQVNTSEDGSFVIAISVGPLTLSVEYEGHSFEPAKYEFVVTKQTSGVYNFSDVTQPRTLTYTLYAGPADCHIPVASRAIAYLRPKYNDALCPEQQSWMRLDVTSALQTQLLPPQAFVWSGERVCSEKRESDYASDDRDLDTANPPSCVTLLDVNFFPTEEDNRGTWYTPGRELPLQDPGASTTLVWNYRASNLVWDMRWFGTLFTECATVYVQDSVRAKSEGTAPALSDALTTRCAAPGFAESSSPYEAIPILEPLPASSPAAAYVVITAVERYGLAQCPATGVVKIFDSIGKTEGTFSGDLECYARVSAALGGAVYPLKPGLASTTLAPFTKTLRVAFVQSPEIPIDSLLGRVGECLNASEISNSADPRVHFDTEVADASLSPVYCEQALVVGHGGLPEDGPAGVEIPQSPLQVKYPLMILRDPPGSRSSATIQSGQSFSIDVDISNVASGGLSASGSAKFGANLQNLVILGQGIPDITIVGGVSDSFSMSASYSYGSAMTHQVTVNQAISTGGPDDTENPGEAGDIIMGVSTFMLVTPTPEIYKLQGQPDEPADVCFFDKRIGFTLNPTQSNHSLFTIAHRDVLLRIRQDCYILFQLALTGHEWPKECGSLGIPPPASRLAGRDDGETIWKNTVASAQGWRAILDFKASTTDKAVDPYSTKGKISKLLTKALAAQKSVNELCAQLESSNNAPLALVAQRVNTAWLAGTLTVQEATLITSLNAAGGIAFNVAFSNLGAMRKLLLQEGDELQLRLQHWCYLMKETSNNTDDFMTQTLTQVDSMTKLRVSLTRHNGGWDMKRQPGQAQQPTRDIVMSYDEGQHPRRGNSHHPVRSSGAPRPTRTRPRPNWNTAHPPKPKKPTTGSVSGEALGCRRKKDALPINTYSISSHVEVDGSITTSSSEAQALDTEINWGGSIGTDACVSLPVVISSSSVAWSGSMSIGNSAATGKAKDLTTAFTLYDGDEGDDLIIQVLEDPVFGTPVFKTLGGHTSCPHESGTQSVHVPEIHGVQTEFFGVKENYVVFVVDLLSVGQAYELTAYAPDGYPLAPNYWLYVNNPTGGLSCSVGGAHLSGAADNIEYYLAPQDAIVGVEILCERTGLKWQHSVELHFALACTWAHYVRAEATQTLSVNFVAPCAAMALPRTFARFQRLETGATTFTVTVVNRAQTWEDWTLHPEGKKFLLLTEYRQDGLYSAPDDGWQTLPNGTAGTATFDASAYTSAITSLRGWQLDPDFSNRWNYVGVVNQLAPGIIYAVRVHAHCPNDDVTLPSGLADVENLAFFEIMIPTTTAVGKREAADAFTVLPNVTALATRPVATFDGLPVLNKPRAPFVCRAGASATTTTTSALQSSTETTATNSATTTKPTTTLAATSAVQLTTTTITTKAATTLAATSAVQSSTTRPITPTTSSTRPPTTFTATSSLTTMPGQFKFCMLRPAHVSFLSSAVLPCPSFLNSNATDGTLALDTTTVASPYLLNSSLFVRS
jgi:hypothetical protein